MSFIAAAIIGGGASLGAAGLGLFGSLSASSQQANAEKQALAEQQAMFGVAQGALQPYINTGNGVGSTLTSLLTPGANQTATLSQLPGFQFAQNWGQQAVQNLGTTTGLGANVLTAGANFATGEAQQGFASLINPLMQLYGTGANAAGALGSAAGTFSGQIGSTTGAIGTAQAQGTLGATSALTGGINGAGNSLINSMLFSRLLNGQNNAAPNPGIYSNQAFAPANAANNPFSSAFQ
jgi:hypothetical protein